MRGVRLLVMAIGFLLLIGAGLALKGAWDIRAGMRVTVESSVASWEPRFSYYVPKLAIVVRTTTRTAVRVVFLQDRVEVADALAIVEGSPNAQRVVLTATQQQAEPMAGWSYELRARPAIGGGDWEQIGSGVMPGP